MVTVKETRDHDYLIELRASEGAVDPRIGEFLPRSYSIRINNALEIVALPYLAEAPWPPEYPTAFDEFSTKDEAARYVVATTPFVVVPREAPTPRIDVIDFPGRTELKHNILWLPENEYVALVEQIEGIMAQPVDASRLRLHELGEGPLKVLLREYLPRASLGERERECLRL